MKIVNFDGENLHILWTTWGISIKCLGKIYDNIKSLKKPGLTISLENTFLEESQEWKKPTSPPHTHTHTHSHTNTHIPTSFPCLLIVKMNPGSIHLQKGFQRYKYFPRSSFEGLFRGNCPGGSFPVGGFHRGNCQLSLIESTTC